MMMIAVCRRYIKRFEKAVTQTILRRRRREYTTGRVIEGGPVVGLERAEG